MTRDKGLMTAIIYVAGKTCCRILYLMWNEEQHLVEWLAIQIQISIGRSKYHRFIFDPVRTLRLRTSGQCNEIERIVDATNKKFNFDKIIIQKGNKKNYRNSAI